MILQVSPGLYPMRAHMRPFCVGADGVVRFDIGARSWAFRLVESARGPKAEDAMRHYGTAQERETARNIATLVLLRAAETYRWEQLGECPRMRRAA